MFKHSVKFFALNSKFYSTIAEVSFVTKPQNSLISQRIKEMDKDLKEEKLMSKSILSDNKKNIADNTIAVKNALDEFELSKKSSIYG